jgi:hypothetical protein
LALMTLSAPCAAIRGAEGKRLTYQALVQHLRHARAIRNLRRLLAILDSF